MLTKKEYNEICASLKPRVRNSFNYKEFVNMHYVREVLKTFISEEKETNANQERI